MKFEFKVIPNAKKIKIDTSEKPGRVYLTSCARAGRANKQLVKVLSEYFKVKKRAVSILSGLKSRNKIVEIDKNL